MKHRYFVVTMLFAFLAFAVALSGCVGDRDAQERVSTYIDGADIALNLGINLAEKYGADTVKVATAREHATLTFALLRDVVKVKITDTDKKSLEEAVEQLKAVNADVLALCRGVGVNEVSVSAIEYSMNQALIVLESIVGALPEQTSFFRPERLLGHDPAMESFA